MMLSGQKNLEVNAVNETGAEVEVLQVFKNNLLHFLNSNRYNYYRYHHNDYGNDDDDYYYYDYYGGNSEYSVGEYGKEIYTEKINLSNKKNWLQKFTVNLSKALNQQRKGIFVVNVHATNDRWERDSKMIAISDLGIICKSSEDEIMVFVNSIATTEPVKDVQINIISTNNQTILSGKTDDDGIIKFTGVKAKIEGFSTRLVTAEKDNDFNYLDLSSTQIETSRFDVGGIYQYSENYNTFIYSDRNLYRTGDKINLVGIVRNDKIKIVKDIPIIIKVITPTGKVFDEFKKTLNDEGSFELSFDIPNFAQTGRYNAEVYSGGTQLLGTYGFNVEDFVPDKIRVRIKTDKEKARPGEIVTANLESEFLFGAKASGLKYQSEIQLRYRPYVSKRYSGYDFSSSSIKNSRVDDIQRDGTLDEDGKAIILDTIPDKLYSGGYFYGNIYASVFDLTGRTVNQTASFNVYPNDYFIGINSEGYYFGTNEKLNFKLVAVDQYDNPVKVFKATAKLVRYEWQTVLKKNSYGQFYYNSEEKEFDEWEKPVDISGGPKDFLFSVSKSGRYQLRISKEGSTDYYRTNFYAYGWGSSTASSFEVNKEGKVDLVFDKEIYNPGDKAKILLTAPFSGKVLLTVERNNVFEHRYIDIENKSTQVEIDVKEDFMPNVYVTATLFKKHTLNSGTPFFVGHGFASMKVEKKEYHLPVAITAPEKIKPNTKQQIKIKTSAEKNIYVTLAAVDEGILQIKNYETPDPYKYMYAKRSLKVGSYDLYKLLLPEIISRNSSTGGDGGAEEQEQLKKRSNPVTAKRFKLLSFWSGIVKTNSDGIVTIPLDIPQFIGDIRLMVVAFSGPRFGSAEEHIKVADDLILQPEMPRFLSTNDTLNSSVSIINTTANEGNVEVRLKVEGPLKIVSSNKQSVTIPANSTGRVNFKLCSGEKVGTGKIIYETSGIAQVKDETEIGVRPISPFFVENGSGNIKAGETLNLEIPKDYVDGTQSASVTISKFPALKFAKHLKYLVGYPYGCIEQTVSKLFPQLYFEDLAKLIAPDLYRTNNPVYYVNEGIKKIESMQLYDGSIAYWQGGDYTNVWGSVYAAHFLIEARKARFNVSESVLSKLLNYISKVSKSNGTYDYVTYSNNKRTVIKIASKEILYALYVLALADKGDIATMNYYKARPHLLTNDTKYLLAGAYALLGQWNTYYEMMPDSFIPEKTIRLTGGCFDSEIRSNAIMLNVLLEVQPASEQIPYIIKFLSNNADMIYSTQERSFTFLSLGKAASINSGSNVNVKINSNGKTLKSYDGKDVTVDIPNPNKAQVSLNASGNGEVYYFWNTGGIKLNQKVKEEDSNLRIRRAYYDYRTGHPILNGTFEQGQLIVCKISLTGLERSAENIVITDMVPAGFEIENPRLSASTKLNWQPKNPLYIQYMDVRDDRLLLFTTLYSNQTKEFYYMLRVVSKGTFQLPVIGAEAMYDPEFHSYNGAGVVKVVESTR